MSRFLVTESPGAPGLVVLPASGFRRARAEISSWSDYAPTPLRDVPDLADVAGVAAVSLKDESCRFGPGCVEALGAAFAVGETVRSELARRGIAPAATTAQLRAGTYSTDALVVTCATDGNHGRSVAWAARRLGARCVVFVPAGVSAIRRAAIEGEGAEVRLAGRDWGESVRIASAAAAAEGWLLVSETSWPGYTETPRLAMQGYRVMADEALDQWTGAPPTHAFVQGWAGAGGVAAAVTVHLRARLGTMPRLVVVEPECAAPLLASAERAARTPPVPTSHPAVGEPSLLAWQELGRSATAFVAIDDAAVADAVRRLAGLGIVSGETGAIGVGGLIAAAADPLLRRTLALEPSSRVLLFSTEGATDPDRYAELLR